MRKLNVFSEDKLIGVLVQDDNLVYSFSYSDEWINDEKSFQLSLAMPLTREVFSNKITRSFFDNLLPEGETREAIERSQGIKSTYNFLRLYGQDCAGAIVISEKEKPDFVKDIASQKLKIEINEIYNTIKNSIPVVELITQKDPGYLSLAGAQDKFSAIYLEDEFYLPLDGSPTTHIIKMPIIRSGIKESVFNEYYCMKLAGLVGLNIPNCYILNHKEYPLYIIERYDRKVGESVQRIHQQDFCQAQGIVSEYKYQAHGGPTLADNFNLIKSHVTIQQRKKALFDYLDWVSFNLLIGNNDSHSKNLSLLHQNEKIELAPFYDLLCTAIYPKLKSNFSFLIGGRDEASRIGKNQFEIVDQELGLKVGTMNSRMKKMSEKLREHKDSLARYMKSEFPQVKIVDRISELIDDRCRSLVRQGS